MSFTLNLFLENSESLIIRKTKTDYLISSSKEFHYIKDVSGILSIAFQVAGKTTGNLYFRLQSS